MISLGLKSSRLLRALFHRTSCSFGHYTVHMPLSRVQGVRSLPAASLRRSTSPSRLFASGRQGNGGGGGGGTGGSRKVRDTGPGGEKGPGSGGLRFWLSYLILLETHPVVTKSVTCALLSGLGDLVCQLFIDQNLDIDKARLLRFTMLGFLLVGPALHFWYLTLSHLAPQPGTSGALMRLALDQLVFAPLFISTFMAALMTLEGRSHMVLAKLKQDLWSAIRVNWTIWVPAQFLNFRYVPQHLQVLAANVTSLVWNTYLSYASNRSLLLTGGGN